MVRNLIDLGYILSEIKTINSTPPLILAAKNHHIDIAFTQYLISLGADPLERSPLSSQPLLNYMAQYGRTHICKWLLKNNYVDLNSLPLSSKKPIKPEENALHIAAQKNLTDLCLHFIQYNFNINLPHPLNGSILLMAIKNKNLVLVNILLKKHAISIPNSQHQSALHLAVKTRNLHACQQLLKYPSGVKINDEDERLKTALHYAVSEDPFDQRSPQEIHQELVLCDWLLSQGANPSSYDINLMTPLLQAVKAGNLKTYRLLLSRGARLSSHKELSQYLETVKANQANLSISSPFHGLIAKFYPLYYLSYPNILVLATQSKNIELCQWVLIHGAEDNHEVISTCYFASVDMKNNNILASFFNTYTPSIQQLKRLKNNHPAYDTHFTQLPTEKINIDREDRTIALMKNDTYAVHNLDIFALTYGVTTSTLLASFDIRRFLQQHPEFNLPWHQLPKEECILNPQKRTLTMAGSIFDMDHIARFYQTTAAQLIQYFGPYQMIIKSQISGGELGISTCLGNHIRTNEARSFTIATATLNSSQRKRKHSTQHLIQHSIFYARPTIEPKVKKKLSPKRKIVGREICTSPKKKKVS
ncbi:MAG TPA: ankyrin repeat domain-containing protein [Gammaproteobacteria bacterium]|nr:ankyrin repeat domain-containing protein [Gammaproteobacteria bacterium]